MSEKLTAEEMAEEVTKAQRLADAEEDMFPKHPHLRVWRALLQSAARVAELEAVLWLIEAMGGKTLISMARDEEARLSYSDGAHHAFNQAADIARSALEKSP